MQSQKWAWKCVWAMAHLLIGASVVLFPTPAVMCQIVHGQGTEHQIGPDALPSLGECDKGFKALWEVT